MKPLMTTSDGGKEEHLYTSYYYIKIAHLPYMQLVMQLQTWIMYLV